MEWLVDQGFKGQMHMRLTLRRMHVRLIRVWGQMRRRLIPRPRFLLTLVVAIYSICLLTSCAISPIWSYGILR